MSVFAIYFRHLDFMIDFHLRQRLSKQILFDWKICICGELLLLQQTHTHTLYGNETVQARIWINET